MKKPMLFLSFLILLSISLTAQTDKVYLHNGEMLEVNVNSVTNGVVSYQYPSESVIQEVSTNMVEKITYSSGRTQKVSDKIVINSKNDWKKVIVTHLESEIKGLVRKGEVFGHKGGSAFSKSTKLQRKATEKMQQEAAKMGAHIVYVTTTKTDMQGSGFRNTASGVTGTAYSYE